MGEDEVVIILIFIHQFAPETSDTGACINDYGVFAFGFYFQTGGIATISIVFPAGNRYRSSGTPTRYQHLPPLILDEALTRIKPQI
jgi:hypothetical protein